MKDRNKSNSREQAELNEKLPTSSVDAPAERFQQTQQSALAEKTSADVDVQPFIKKKVKSRGPVLKTEVISEAITGKSGGAPGGVVSASTFGLKEVSFSGDTGSLLGNVSGTPVMGKSYQGETRLDKRLSDKNKDINFNASEQIAVEYDNIPPLAASESTVGYNGNPKNIAARSQKKTGVTPAESLFDRSLDLIEKDAFVFSTGQVVKQDGVNYQDYPTQTISSMTGEAVPFESVRGNYSPREIQVKLKSFNGVVRISSFEVFEDDLSCNAESDVVVNAAATNHIIDMNRAELSRQTIDADAGSPTAEHFNPLGRSVSQPTATVAYLQDIENVTGAEVFASYKFANKARGHYLNRTAKDGQLLLDPALDALYGHLFGFDNCFQLKAALNLNEEGELFSVAGMRAGSAALMIPIFDSMGKYKTKADLVNQPRGLKMHIQTADNNMDPFHVKKEFVAALNGIDCYSTIDHEYDGTMPVFITDNVRLVHPYSWNKALKYHRDNASTKTYDSQVMRYSYAAGSGLNTYDIIVGDPILNGVAYFLEMHTQAIWNAITTKAERETSGFEAVLHIPVVHSTTHFSLWDLLVCASTPYIIYERTNALKDILDYEMFYKYPFMGNVRIADANPLNGVNYGTLNPYGQIPVQVMSPTVAMSWRFPEIFSHIDKYVLLPYYFNERSVQWVNVDGIDSTYRENGSFEHTTPIVRSGMKLSGLDEYFGLEVIDELLLTDRWMRIPGVIYGSDVEGTVYKYDQNSDGVLALSRTQSVGITAKDIYSTPRLLGWYFDAPAGTCQCNKAQSGTTWVSGLTGMESITLTDMLPSFRAVMYKGVYGLGDKHVLRPLDVGSVNVNRAQAFAQNYYIRRAGREIQAGNGFDLCLSIGDGISYNNEVGTNPRFVTVENFAHFSPFVYGPYHVSGSGVNRAADNTAYDIDVDDRPIVFSMHRVLWPLLQKLPFIINPFEQAKSGTAAADPFGLAYVFGLAGFMSANFDEELFNRANAVQNDGYGYTEDPMIAKSPVFKDAYSKTQIG